MLIPPVSRYMTPRPWSVAARDKLSRAKQLMADHHVHHLPVVENDELVGIVSDRDLLGIRRTDMRVAEAMTCDVLAVPGETTLDQVMAMMEDRNCGSVVVTDRSGVLGIFTRADAMRAFGDVLRRTVEEVP